MYLRHFVNQVDISALPEINEANTREMLSLLELYSTQRYHDVQILYFYTKHNGDYVEASLELGCHYMTMYWRIRQLDARFSGKILSTIPAVIKRKPRGDIRVSNEQIEEAAKMCSSIREMADKLGIRKTAIIERAKRWGITLPKGIGGRKRR